MNKELLQRLLLRQEGPDLEFKRSWYGIDDPAAKKQQRDELVKDVLSLANGSPDAAGSPAFLVIGADDERDSSGARRLHDVGRLPVESLRKTVVQLVASAAEPPIQDLAFDLVDLDGVQLAVVTVPPSPYLHETTRDLLSFSERVVFIRRGDSIRVASAGERDAISRLKRLHFHETRNAPPVRYGMAIGALSGGLALLTETIRSGGPALERVSALGVGIFVFGLLGGCIGFAYRQLADLVHRRELLPGWLRALMSIAAVGGLVWFVSHVVGMILE